MSDVLKRSVRCKERVEKTAFDELCGAMMNFAEEYVASVEGPDPEDEFDEGIIELCSALNEFPGIKSVESCQGYVDDHIPGKPWAVYFEPDGPISKQGYCSIEFLAWVLGRHEAGAAGFDVSLTLGSAAPYLNGPGTSLYFSIKGYAGHPDELAAFVRKMRKKCFVLPEKCLQA